MNPPILHCIFGKSLFDWETEVFRKFCAQLASDHQVICHENGVKSAPIAKQDRIWIASRDWQKTLRSVPEAKRANQKVFISALGRPQNEIMPLLFWKNTKQALSANTVFLTHCAMNYRYYHEIGAVPSTQLRNLSLPAPILKEPSVIGPAKKRPIVAGFGALTSDNNLNFFMNLAHYLVRQYPDVIVRFYGKGPLRAHMQRMIERLNLGAHVSLVETGDLSSIRYADVFWYHPLQNDSFIPLVTAGALGKAVVCSEILGIEHYVKDTHDGFIFPVHETRGYGEVTARLLADANLRDAIGKNFQRRILGTYGSSSLLGIYETLFFASERGAANAA